LGTVAGGGQSGVAGALTGQRFAGALVAAWCGNEPLSSNTVVTTVSSDAYAS
jgi:hypothetical protein